MQEPTIGRIVHYTLTEEDAQQINRRRTTGESIRERMHNDGGEPKWPAGAQAHIGNYAHAGDVVPMMIVRTWHNEGHYLRGDSVLNGQAFLDGNDTFWVQSANEGEGYGEWRWPQRV